MTTSHFCNQNILGFEISVHNTALLHIQHCGEKLIYQGCKFNLVKLVVKNIIIQLDAFNFLYYDMKKLIGLKTILEAYDILMA